MTDAVVVIRFPDGDVEFDGGATIPTVGDRLTKRGQTWRVARVDDASGCVTVTLMPDAVVADDSWRVPFTVTTRPHR